MIGSDILGTACDRCVFDNATGFAMYEDSASAAVNRSNSQPPDR